MEHSYSQLLNDVGIQAVTSLVAAALLLVFTVREVGRRRGWRLPRLLSERQVHGIAQVMLEAMDMGHTMAYLVIIP